MAIFTVEQYSRKQTEDLETSISQAVQAVLSRSFVGPGGSGVIAIQPDQFFTDWADMNDNFVDPSAAIMPDGELKYGPSHPTPVLLEETWEPPGEQGFGLLELSEASREFEIAVRTGSAAARSALKAGIETAFQDPRGLTELGPGGIIGSTRTAGGDRYGVVVQAMPSYWSLGCRLTLLGSRKIDDSDSASRNIWEARFRVMAEAPHVRLQVVQPMRVKIRLVEEDAEGNPI